MTDILQFEEEIGRLEARISYLEDENEALKKLLADRDSFSAAVAAKIHKMDCLLDKRTSLITDLMSQLEKRAPQTGLSGQDSTEIDDFSVDLGPVNVKQEFLTPETPDKFEEKIYLKHLEGKPEGRVARTEHCHRPLNSRNIELFIPFFILRFY